MRNIEVVIPYRKPQSYVSLKCRGCRRMALLRFSPKLMRCRWCGNVQNKKVIRDVFTGLPVSTNVWRHLHWAKQNQLKKDWLNAMHVEYRLHQGQPVIKFQPPVRLKVKIFKVGVLGDLSRVYVDDMQDFFVSEGFIADDSPQYMLQPVVKQISVKTKAEQKTIVSLSEELPF